MQLLRKWGRISGEAVPKIPKNLKTHFVRPVDHLPVGFKTKDSGLRLGREIGSDDAQAIASACHSAGGVGKKLGNVESNLPALTLEHPAMRWNP